jgi:hypothetical protein
MSDVPRAPDDGADEFEPGGRDDEIEEIEEGAGGPGEGIDGGGDTAEEDPDEDEGLEGSEGDAGRTRGVSRPESPRESRFQRNVRLRREAEAKANALEERLARLENSQRQPQQPDPETLRRQEREFLESLRMMDPVDAANAVASRKEQQFVQALQAVRMEGLDRQDRSEFNLAARADPAMGRLRPQVESAIAEARRMGNFSVTRMDIFYRLYGEEMAARRNTERPRQQRSAQRRVAAETTRPVSGRGEGARGRRPEEGTRESDDAIIADMRRRGVPLF